MLLERHWEPVNMKAIVISVLLVFFCAQAAMAAEELELSPQQIEALGIGVAQLPPKSSGEIAGIPALVVIPGNQLFVVSTPLAGMVEQTLVGVGDHVHKGQTLAKLQSPALAEAQRDLLQASTQERLAKSNFTRDEQLWKDGIVAESRYRSSQSLYQSTAAGLAEKKQMLLLAGMSAEAIERLQAGENLHSLLVIASPIDGVILEKTASAGQRLDSAAPLFKVARLQPLGLEIQDPLASTQGIKEGAEVNIPAYAAKGKITAIGHSLSDSNQTILLRALINQGTQNLRPGQHVDVSIAIAANKAVQWYVPNSSVARIEGRSVVFVESKTGFRAETVTILNEGVQGTLITGKLSGKEKIAVRGISALKGKLMGIGGSE
jgi:membrane fusion protein, heavy metal efflux system